MVRILIADDHEVVRSGVRRILEAQPRWEVVAEAADGNEAVAMAIEATPDVAVLDYSLPLKNGIEATREIRSRSPRTEVLIFTMYDNDQVLESLIGAGARGYLLKSDANSHLVDAVAALAARKPFFTARLSETTRNSVLSARNGRKSVLTSRERDVAQLIADGHTNKQIADALTIGLKTVEAHRAAIMRKLELSSSAALVRYAIRNGIVRL